MNNYDLSEEEIEVKYTLTILICAFLGNLGIHRFINGKIATGIVMLLTCGGLGIWGLIDFIIIYKGDFKNSNGIPIRTKNKNSLVNIFAIMVLVLNIVSSLVFIFLKP